MLTIVIPYYKIVFFEATLQSLANQTNKKFKVVIGNDNSAENPTELINKYTRNFEVKYQKFETNLGGTSLIKQWQRCLELVDTNSWVLILGDDDVLSENVVEEFYRNKEKFESQKQQVVRFATQRIDYRSNTISNVYVHPEIEKSTKFIIRRFKRETRSSLSEYVFKNDIIDSLEKVDFPLAWNSDVALILQHSNFGNVFSINSALVSIRSSTKSISGSDDYPIEKRIANQQFDRYIIRNLHFFENLEKRYLLKRFEKSYANNRRNKSLFFDILKYYVSNFEFKKLFKFLIKIIFKAKSKKLNK